MAKPARGPIRSYACIGGVPMPFACQKCPFTVAVQAGDRPPPWCPRCGSNLKDVALETKPVRIAAGDFSPPNASDGAALAPGPLGVAEEGGPERAPLPPTPAASADGEGTDPDTSGEF